MRHASTWVVLPNLMVQPCSSSEYLGSKEQTGCESKHYTAAARKCNNGHDRQPVNAAFVLHTVDMMIQEGHASRHAPALLVLEQRLRWGIVGTVGAAWQTGHDHI